MKSFNRRAVYTVLLWILVSFSFFYITVEAAFARFDPVERSEEELLIFETYVHDERRSSGMLAYLPDGEDISHTLLPISSVARVLSFSIQGDPVQGVIDGWFFSEDNTLHVDSVRNIVRLNGQERAIPAGAIEVHYDDVYVQAHILEDWLGIKFRFDFSMLRLHISSDRPFPFEEEMNRKKRSEALSGGYRKDARDFASDKLLPYQWWSKPSLVVQQNVQGRQNDGESSVDAGFSVQSSFDAMKFGTKLLLSGTTGTNSSTKIDTARLTFERRDPGNELLGPLKAGSVSVGDVNYPNVPLVIGRKRGRGVSVSSDSKYGNIRSYNAETYNVDGDAPIGWDAELYRNGYFVAFQDIGSDGRYNFEDVELVRGFNLLQVILYGPEGQKRTETQRVMRGQDILREGEVDYEFAVGQPEADFIPVAETARASSDFGGSGQISYGVKDYLTVGANVYSGEDSSGLDDNRQTSAGVTAVAAFAGVKVGVQATAANEGRRAYGADATTQIKGTNVTVAHEVYKGFHEDEEDLEKKTSLDVHRNFKRVSVSGRVEQNSFQKKDDETHLEANISTNIGRFQFTNSLDRVLSDNEAQESFQGEFSAVTGLVDWRLRTNLTYDFEKGVEDKFKKASVSAYKKFGGHSTVRLNGDYTFDSNLASLNGRYTRDFDRYSIDFSAGATNQDDYFGGVTFRTGLQSDHNGRYRIVNARDGGLGSVGLRTFIDLNGNGVFDKGEPPVKGVSFRSNRGVMDGKTAEDGTVFLSGLPEGPTIFYLQEASLPSIYLKPVDESIEIIPRSGATTTIDVAFTRLGEIDGFVIEKGTEDEPMAGVIVVLYDASTGEELESVNSEYDGYYIFSALPIADYRVEAIPLWGDEEEQVSLDVSLSHEEPIATDMNLSVVSPRVVQKDEKEKGENKVSTPVEGGGYYIHVGSMSSQSGAEGEQQRIWAKYQVLRDIVPGVYHVQVKGRDFYRILGAVPSKDAGQELCDAMQTGGAMAGGCSVLKM